MRDKQSTVSTYSSNFIRQAISAGDRTWAIPPVKREQL